MIYRSPRPINQLEIKRWDEYHCHRLPHLSKVPKTLLLMEKFLPKSNFHKVSEQLQPDHLLNFLSWFCVSSDRPYQSLVPSSSVTQCPCGSDVHKDTLIGSFFNSHMSNTDLCSNSYSMVVVYCFHIT